MNTSTNRFQTSFLIPLNVLLLLSLAGCGGGRGGGDEHDTAPAAYIDIERSEQFNYCGKSGIDCSLTVSGTVFNEYYVNSRSGRCSYKPPLDIPGAIGVTVGWENISNGKSGRSYVYWGGETSPWPPYTTYCSAKWEARGIPLSWGKNIIVLEGWGSSGRKIKVQVTEFRNTASDFKLSGEVKGLNGDGLILQNNGSQDLAVAGLSFEFPVSIPDGDNYSISVLQQPIGQVCILTNGNGSIKGAEVEDIVVFCSAWEQAELVEQIDDTIFESPEVIIDKNGNAYAFWTTNNQIWVNQYLVDAGWGTPQKLQDNYSIMSSPQFAIDAMDNAVIFWETVDGFWLSHYLQGAGWNTPEQLMLNSSNGRTPQFVIGPIGNFLVLWRHVNPLTSSFPSELRASSYYLGSGWGPTDLLDLNPEWPVSVKIESDNKGGMVAVWPEDDISSVNGDNVNIWAKRHTILNGWENAKIIGGKNYGLDRFLGQLQVALGETGNAVVVWLSSGEVQSNQYSADVGWGVQKKVGTWAYTTPLLENIAFDSEGNALLVWEGQSSQGNIVRSNRYDVISGWSEEIDLINTTSTGGVFPKLAMCDDGNAFVVWPEADEIKSKFFAKEYGWRATGSVSTNNIGFNYSTPRIAVDTECNAMVVWHQKDSQNVHADTSIWSSRFER